jgi:hypothetical protein
MRRRFSVFAAVAALSLSACGPSGFHPDGTLLDGPAAAFSVSPNDVCKRTDVMQGSLAVLNGKIGQTDGPPAQVMTTSEFAAAVDPSEPAAQPGWNSGVLFCRGFLQTATGPIGPGILQIRGNTTSNNNGTIAAFSVLDAKWETDADHNRREAKIAAVVGSSPETRQLICTGPDAVAYLTHHIRDISSPDLELRDVASVNSRTCRATVVENGKRTPGIIKLERYSGYERITWANDAGGRIISWPTGVRFNEPPNDPIEDIHRRAEKNPNEMVGCAVEGPKQIFTTYAVCYAVIKFVRDNSSKLKPYAGYALIQECSRTNSRVCYAIIDELRNLAAKVQFESKMALIEKCADDLAKKFSGKEKPQYMNTCQDIIDGYFN